MLQGLAHAEWEKARGGRTDAQGKPIARPAHWVFETLARQGYYPRPAEAFDARLESAQTAWAVQLSPEEETRSLVPRSRKRNLFVLLSGEVSVPLPLKRAAFQRLSALEKPLSRLVQRGSGKGEGGSGEGGGRPAPPLFLAIAEICIKQ